MARLAPGGTGDADAMRRFDALLDGEMDAAGITDFLTALADRGETVDEIVAAARALRARMVPVAAVPGAIDVCGTGGDGSHSLNVSTAVAIVVAACGIPVAKHGNRAASSRAGAADTLEALGLDLDIAEETAGRALAELGICFLFAQRHHPALAPLAPIRRAIGRRTIFNLLGPLVNPAGVKRQLVGVARPEWVMPMAEALRALGAERALVVHGDGGLDEFTVSGQTDAALLHDDEIERISISPEQAGLSRHPLEALKGGDAAFNAAALRRLLAGEAGAYRDAVLLNAAAALIVARAEEDWKQAAQRAAAAIDTGAASALLDRWIAFR